MEKQKWIDLQTVGRQIKRQTDRQIDRWQIDNSLDIQIVRKIDRQID